MNRKLETTCECAIVPGRRHDTTSCYTTITDWICIASIVTALLFYKRLCEHKNKLIKSKNEKCKCTKFYYKKFTENSIKLFDGLNHPLWCVSVSSWSKLKSLTSWSSGQSCSELCYFHRILFLLVIPSLWTPSCVAVSELEVEHDRPWSGLCRSVSAHLINYLCIISSWLLREFHMRDSSFTWLQHLIVQIMLHVNEKAINAKYYKKMH